MASPGELQVATDCRPDSAGRCVTAENNFLISLHYTPHYTTTTLHITMWLNGWPTHTSSFITSQLRTDPAEREELVTEDGIERFLSQAGRQSLVVRHRAGSRQH